jgi:hypothetical protein
VLPESRATRGRAPAARWRRPRREQCARVTSGFCTSGPKGNGGVQTRYALHGDATCAAARESAGVRGNKFGQSGGVRPPALGQVLCVGVLLGGNQFPLVIAIGRAALPTAISLDPLLPEQSRLCRRQPRTILRRARGGLPKPCLPGQSVPRLNTSWLLRTFVSLPEFDPDRARMATEQAWRCDPGNSLLVLCNRAIHPLEGLRDGRPANVRLYPRP